MEFTRFCWFLGRIEAQVSRLAMTEVLAELLGELKPVEVRPAVYLALGQLGPKFANPQFNLAEKQSAKAVALAGGVAVERVRQEYKDRGDLGEVAESLARTRKGSQLGLVEVYGRLVEIANEEGQGSQERKIMGLAELLERLSGQESKYAVRIVLNKLRLGFSDMTLLDAMSWYLVGDKSVRGELERGFNVATDIGYIAELVVGRKVGRVLEAMRQVQARVGVPIRPALAERLPSMGKIVEKLGTGEGVAVEPKYDGLRLQAHVDMSQRVAGRGGGLFGGGEEQVGVVRLFSRSLDEMTKMFPEVVESLREWASWVGVRSVILDGEVIVVDEKTGKVRPFQETMKRKRKHEVGATAKSLPAKLFVYDLLLWDGRGVWQERFRRRRERLVQALAGWPGLKQSSLALTEQEVVKDPGKIMAKFAEYIKLGLEGVMCKKLDEPYTPGARNFNWVKYKPTTEGSGLADTLDCMVLGYYAGRGKRAGFGIGAFLVGVRQGERVVTVSKIGTGLTDEQWREMKKRADDRRVETPPPEYRVPKGLVPDEWVAPGLVVEIKADQVTNSPLHTAGVALRFPRLVRFRDDKEAEGVTTVAELAKM